MPTAGAMADGRILTVPNVITMVRLACLPVFLWLLFGRDDPLQAGILLAVLGVTDFLDGYVARRFDQGSKLGQVLDPLADRLLFLVGALAIIFSDAAPLWFGVLVLVREGAVSIIALVLASRNPANIAVSWWGKAGTLLLMIAFPLFLGGISDSAYADLFGTLAWVIGIPGLVISYYSAFAYLPSVRRALATDRQEDDAPAGPVRAKEPT